MRPADAKGGSVKRLALYLLLSVPALAAVDGTVINQTTGKPANNATVTLYKLGQAGPEALETVHSDAQGKFTIKQNAEGGPHNLQATYDGVTYAHILRPGSPTTGITLEVYNASKQPGGAKVANHFLILQPSPGQLLVSEVFLYRNEGKTAYNDPDNGTLKFYLPPAAKGSVKVQAKAPNGMPIEQLAQKAAKADVYKVDFPIKPGETQFEVSYTEPYTSPGRFGSKDLSGAAETLLVAPQGVTLKGDGVEFSRQEPRTQASIYAAKKASFEFEISGQMQPSEQQGQAEEANNGPAIEQLMPKLFDQVNGSASLIQKVLAVKWILLLALGILGLGFLQLYRKQEPVEAASAAAPTRPPRGTATSGDSSTSGRDRKGAVESHERRRR
jgi:hypothetical protein